MIKSIKVTNQVGESLLLDLANPSASGFVIASASGLGPGMATINMSDYASTDGAKFTSARSDKRNIVLELKFFWGEDSIEELRYKCYRYFPIKQKITLTITTDSRVCTIDGYVESNETEIFSSEEGSEISIICPDPYFYAEFEQQSTISHTLPNFEFPFSNETNDSNTEMSVWLDVPTAVLSYNGDSEVGMIWTIDVHGPVTNISLYNVKSKEIFTIDTDKLKSYANIEFKDGDMITVNTIKGNKSISLFRDGKTTNILNCVSKGSKWLQLRRGENIYAFTAATGSENLNITIRNKVAYDGV